MALDATELEQRFDAWWDGMHHARLTMTARPDISDAEINEMWLVSRLWGLLQVVFHGYDDALKKVAALADEPVPNDVRMYLEQQVAKPTLAEVRAVCMQAFFNIRWHTHYDATIAARPEIMLAPYEEQGDRLHGGFLTVGNIMVLSGQGGSGKSLLTTQMAVELALGDTVLIGGAFEAKRTGGKVLIMSWEDTVPVIAHRARRIFNYHCRHDRDLLSSEDMLRENLAMLDMEGIPLFGPETTQHYGTRPVKLPGWTQLQFTLDTLEPQYLIIDPAASAFCGDPNSVPSVREFVVALRQECRERDLGCILVAHSNKEARKDGNHKSKQDQPDPHGDRFYDPSLIAGSTAWVDAVRGVVALTNDEGESVVSVVKSNYGSSRIACYLQAERGIDDQDAPSDQNAREILAFRKALNHWSGNPTPNRD